MRNSSRPRQADITTHCGDYQVRAFLLERGLVVAKRPAQLKAVITDILENAEADLTPMMRNLIKTLWEEWKTVRGRSRNLVRNWSGSPLPMPAAPASGRSQA